MLSRLSLTETARLVPRWRKNGFVKSGTPVQIEILPRYCLVIRGWNISHSRRAPSFPPPLLFSTDREPERGVGMNYASRVAYHSILRPLANCHQLCRVRKNSKCSATCLHSNFWCRISRRGSGDRASIRVESQPLCTAPNDCFWDGRASVNIHTANHNSIKYIIFLKFLRFFKSKRAK